MGKRVEEEEMKLKKRCHENKVQEMELIDKNHRLYQTTENLLNMKSLMSDVELTLSTQRESALEEISRLSEVKHSVTNHMLLFSESHQRADRMGYHSVHAFEPSLTSSSSGIHSKQQEKQQKLKLMSNRGSSLALSTSSIPYHRHPLVDRVPTAASKTVDPLDSIPSRVEGTSSPSSFPFHDDPPTSQEDFLTKKRRESSQLRSSQLPFAAGRSAMRGSGGAVVTENLEEDHGIQSEINDLRAEMLKLSEKSAAVLKSAVEKSQETS